MRSAAKRIEEQRVGVTEDRIELELSLGRHADLTTELAALVEQYPLRERLHGQLMLALYRSGRRAEALDVYRRARLTLVDDLGIEPNAWLCRLEISILTGDPALEVKPAPSAVGAGVPLPAGGGYRATAAQRLITQWPGPRGEMARLL